MDLCGGLSARLSNELLQRCLFIAIDGCLFVSLFCYAFRVAQYGPSRRCVRLRWTLHKLFCTCNGRTLSTGTSGHGHCEAIAQPPLAALVLVVSIREHCEVVERY